MIEALKTARRALEIAEAALSDIGDADREPGNDLAWCEERAAVAIQPARDGIAAIDAALAQADAPAESIDKRINKRNARALLDDLMAQCELIGFDKGIEAAKARAASAPAAPGWQPIETAPKDCASLLVSARGFMIGNWAQYARYNSPKFTHWMPLPAAPKEQP